MASVGSGQSEHVASSFSFDISKKFALFFSFGCVALILSLIFYSGSSTSSLNLCGRSITPYSASTAQLQRFQEIMECTLAGIPLLNMLGASVYALRNDNSLNSRPDETSAVEEAKIVELDEDFFLDFSETFPSLVIEEVFNLPSEGREKITQFLRIYGNRIEYFESGQYGLNRKECIERGYARPVLNECFKRQQPSGWRKLGSGWSKEVWTYKDLPHYVMKFFDERGIETVSEELEKIKSVDKSIVANQFQCLEVPPTALIKRSNGYFLIQRFMGGGSYEDSISEKAAPLTGRAVQEFIQLFQELKLCDLGLGIAGNSQHNILWEEKSIETDSKLIKIPVIKFFDLNCPLRFSSSEDWESFHEIFIHSHDHFLEALK